MSTESYIREMVSSAREAAAGLRIASTAAKNAFLTALADRPKLVVAVDAANDPAIAVYTSVGFHAWDRRTVYVKLLQPEKPGISNK